MQVQTHTSGPLPVLRTDAQVPSQTDAGGLRSLFGPSLRSALFVAVVTGLAYPLVTTLVAQAAFPKAANGSLITRQGSVVGSALIGQEFASPRYFQGRPSATTAPDPDKADATVAAPYNAALSAATNQGSTHAALKESVAARVAAYRELNGLAADAAVPVDAVTASASGLDPHISVANAELQLSRVARERQLPVAKVQELLRQQMQPRVLGLLGEPRVNVLQLNLALDDLSAATLQPAAANAAKE
ncbi:MULTISPECIES: potassium-transporting ATPase subunit KdpC [Delftia]|uniref:potassium-transporting ATPase subunit KdpC n=1 Tax=Delftia TaxID=80865 RepID=UPI000929194A|nr:MULTISPECIES: potassium-transporting ATPase subunit KdpC [Delftia]MDH0421119.1 potassium-transporting ATPase subunit KdpC [Delftia tsuruhatensis]MPT04950.1 potassium-transporting ATPase subunit KdpC [Delftia sp.]OJX09725.1 MAG: potassium-transporting ATPase subunit C [Delftia sp. 67-8]QFS63501.1 potassium-transporting ATPase subunit KdpC [Delftia tsuruhatensis]WON90828.1 potassium-transporting ATPase subunit KdpC [Delftia sp. UGAL515B_04]